MKLIVRYTDGDEQKSLTLKVDYMDDVKAFLEALAPNATNPQWEPAHDETPVDYVILSWEPGTPCPPYDKEMFEIMLDNWMLDIQSEHEWAVEEGRTENEWYEEEDLPKLEGEIFLWDGHWAQCVECRGRSYTLMDDANDGDIRFH